MSDKVISACHKLKAHLNDTKVLSNRELVSPHNLRKRNICKYVENVWFCFISITVSSLGLIFFPAWAFICGRESGSS